MNAITNPNAFFKTTVTKHNSIASFLPTGQDIDKFHITELMSGIKAMLMMIQYFAGEEVNYEDMVWAKVYASRVADLPEDADYAAFRPLRWTLGLAWTNRDKDREGASAFLQAVLSSWNAYCDEQTRKVDEAAEARWNS